MISKVVIGRDMYQLLRYVETKEGAYLLDTNLAARNLQEMANEFMVSAALKQSLSRYVWHTTLSVESDEKLSDRQWGAIALDYLERMDFGSSQYAVYKHCDTEHHHIHIVASRIDLADGTVVSDSWNWPRSEAAVREIEKRYHLRQLEPSTQKMEAAPTTEEVRMARRTGKTPIRLKIQAEVKEALSKSESLEAFVDNLAQRGVSVRLYRREEQLTGISYGLNGIAFPGGKLGKMFSLPKVMEAIEQGREQERERLRAKYRRQYQQTRDSLPSGISPRQVDRAIALLLLKDGNNLEEVKAVLSQSDRVRDMKATQRSDIYQQKAKVYINSVVRSAKIMLKQEQQLTR